MTKLLSILAVAAFLTVGGISTASAHCGSCGAESHEKSGEMKPCTKCVKAGKPCKCGGHAKKPCEKKLSEAKKPCTKCMKKKYNHDVVPCKKCEESERKFEEAKTGTHLRSNIGSLQVQSRGRVDTGYND